MSIRRIASVAAVVASLLAFAGITPVSGIGGLFTPGQLRGSGSSGFGQFLDQSTQISGFIELQTGFETFRPHRPGGSPLITLDTGVLNLSFNSFGDFGFGCWLFPKDDFVVNGDLSATFTFDSTDPRVTECPGDPVGTSVLGAPPAVGPSGLVVGLTGPVQLTAVWSPASPITTTRTTTRMSCKPFTSIEEGTSQSEQSTISGSATGTFINTGPFSAQLSGGSGDVTSGSSKIEIIGPPSNGCGPF